MGVKIGQPGRAIVIPGTGVQVHSVRHTASVGNDKYLIVSFGESNSGGYALNSDAAAWELASRSDIQMWNVTTSVFENLDIGTNNNIDHAGLNSTTHGWELGLANRVRQGYFDRPVYYLQTGQGGSVIADWNVGGTFWPKYLARTAAVKSAISNYETIVWLTLGINDAIAGTVTATYKAGLSEIISRIKTDLPGCKIYIATLPPVNGTYTAYSTAISEIVAADSGNLRLIDVVAPVAVSMSDASHWSYAGMKRLSARFVASMANDFPLTPKNFTWSQRGDAGYVYTTASDQYSYVVTSWAKAAFTGFQCDLNPAGAGLVIVADGDTNAVGWSGVNDDYYAGLYGVTIAAYGTVSNGAITPGSSVGAIPAWARLSPDGDNLILSLSTDGGAPWSVVYTYTNAIVSATTIYIKSLSAIGAAATDIWQ